MGGEQVNPINYIRRVGLASDPIQYPIWRGILYIYNFMGAATASSVTTTLFAATFNRFSWTFWVGLTGLSLKKFVSYIQETFLAHFF